MPLLAALLKTSLGYLYLIAIAFVRWWTGVRLALMLYLAAAYVACVTAFTTFISPHLATLFATSYGQVIGLAFPPIAGTVLVGVVGLWGCIVLKNYVMKIVKVGVS